ncbi:uncharacterized protein LOC110695347 [Chenopodium quinoa]|uniref:uncharacterized protein LOC110695347 n=1 Tax=Chenopodium quinoa TaxID=63459 RepID=UPI000B7803A1|nr:uncharacterized protein LOC110695347 [Chenopodium quinoa]
MGISSSKSMADVELGQESDFDSRRMLFQRARGHTENKLKGVAGYLPLYKAAIAGKWNEATKFLDKDPGALTAKITIASETALHIAVGAVEKNYEFVETLIRRMSPEDLALTDQNGETALSVAAVTGNVKAAKLLVDKNPDLPNIVGKSGFPIHRAAEYGHENMIWYLWDVTSDQFEPSPFTGRSGVELLNHVINAEFFDIALKLVNRYPNMATTDGHDIELESPLTVLARISSAFPSGCGVTLTPSKPHFYNPVKFSGLCKKRKLKEDKAMELVKSLCTEILQMDDSKAFNYIQEPVLIAAKLGTHEIIEEIVKAFPPAIWAADNENRNMFELAVLHRRENVFNLIYQMSGYRHLVTRYLDVQDNNILHLAGQLPRPDRLKLVSGAALQVQRELQWFQEVEKFVQPGQKEKKNKEGKTPWMVFSETHQELMKEGEKWMKETASACTVASTLITTIVFSAAMNVPGGESSEGSPNLYHHWAFTAFAVTDAISLFFSVTAVLTFLKILTSRYTEKDFLHFLPRRLIFGLTMLFLSILNMAVAFSSAIYLLFGFKRAIIVISVGAPILLYNLARLMFPLLHRYIGATYYCGIFRKQKDRILH